MPKDLPDTSESDLSNVSDSDEKQKKPIVEKRKSSAKGDSKPSSSKKKKRRMTSSDDSSSEEERRKRKKKTKKVKQSESSSDSSGDEGVDKLSFAKDANGEQLIDVSGNRYMKVNSFKGNTYVHIREYYSKDGALQPGKKGIALNASQWKKFKAAVGYIDGKFSDL